MGIPALDGGGRALAIRESSGESDRESGGVRTGMNQVYVREWNGQPDEWTDGNGMDEHIGGLVNEWGNGCAERFEGECVGCVGVGEIVGLRKRLGVAVAGCLPLLFFFLSLSFFWGGFWNVSVWLGLGF